MNLVYELSTWLENLEKGLLDKKQTEDLHHTLLLIRKSLVDMKKENENLSDQLSIINTKLTKEQHYSGLLKKERDSFRRALDTKD